MSTEIPTSASDTAAPSTLGGDLLIPIACVLLAVYYIATTADLTWEARATGWLVGGALLTLCTAKAIALAINVKRGRTAGGFGGLFAASPLNRRRLALMAMLASFVGALPWIGTTLGLFLSLVAGMVILGSREWRTILTIAGATAATVFLLFMLLLGSRLPRGAVDEWLFSLVRWVA